MLLMISLINFTALKSEPNLILIDISRLFLIYYSFITIFIHELLKPKLNNILIIFFSFEINRLPLNAIFYSHDCV